jgi:hypothetical protein
MRWLATSILPLSTRPKVISLLLGGFRKPTRNKENRAVIELTARLTLSSCVSQLTTFYTTEIAQVLVDNGLATIRINLVDENGELMPQFIELSPDTNGNAMDGRKKLSASVRIAANTQYRPNGLYLFTVAIAVGSISWSAAYKCALHVCGDFLKFYYSV